MLSVLFQDLKSAKTIVVSPPYYGYDVIYERPLMFNMMMISKPAVYPSDTLVNEDKSNFSVHRTVKTSKHYIAGNGSF